MVSLGGPVTEADVLVIGGGPAGLAAALAAREQGLSVVLADRGQPPLDKACGEGLLPDGVAALQGAGVEPNPREAFPLRGIRFIEADLAAEASFPEGHGLGLRRTRLHRLLAERAHDVGVKLHWRTQIDADDPDRMRIGGRAVDCRWIVGADGVQSRIRRAIGLAPAWTGPRRIGVRQHFRLRPWSDFVEVHWCRGTQAYVTPVGTDEVCIAVLGGGAAARLADITTMFPALARRLSGAERIGPMRGAVSASLSLRAVSRGKVALVGDASGMVDAITGEGVSLALQQAAALGMALGIGDLTRYEAAHRRMLRRPLLMARLLLLMGAHDRLRHSALRALAERPRLFEHLLAVHLDRRNPAARPFELCRLGLRLLQGGLPPLTEAQGAAGFAPERQEVWIGSREQYLGRSAERDS